MLFTVASKHYKKRSTLRLSPYDKSKGSRMTYEDLTNAENSEKNGRQT